MVLNWISRTKLTHPIRRMLTHSYSGRLTPNVDNALIRLTASCPPRPSPFSRMSPSLFSAAKNASFAFFSRKRGSASSRPAERQEDKPNFILPAKLAMGSVCSLIFFIFRIGN